MTTVMSVPGNDQITPSKLKACAHTYLGADPRHFVDQEELEWRPYIERVMQQVNPNMPLSPEAMLVIDDMIWGLTLKILNTAKTVMSPLGFQAFDPEDPWDHPDGEERKIIKERTLLGKPQYLVILSGDDFEYFWPATWLFLADLKEAGLCSLLEPWALLGPEARAAAFDAHKTMCAEVDPSAQLDYEHISSRSIQIAIRMVLKGELVKHAVSEGTKAITKWTSSKRPSVHHPPTEHGVEMTTDAGLQFPVGLVGVFSARLTGCDVSPGAAVYAAAVLEYMSAEILELTGNAARKDGLGIAFPKHVAFAVVNDEELSALHLGRVLGVNVDPTFLPRLPVVPAGDGKTDLTDEMWLGRVGAHFGLDDDGGDGDGATDEKGALSSRIFVGPLAEREEEEGDYQHPFTNDGKDVEAALEELQLGGIDHKEVESQGHLQLAGVDRADLPPPPA
eukprot:CAMPEP_0119492504 /NCGR_PEP_ID=MMETSP1344-20130328/17028_1 /TAXON_ID=236787 /ORGANISM="Florenciella parvula, Strain CCMP2471" /LENGTH=448 /DNA_ID=CAMNT_0007527843 /DNA_START=31 /DNA_END=1374 /DNA_ORIENTATION=+